jgi:hypothetical protein
MNQETKDNYRRHYKYNITTDKPCSDCMHNENGYHSGCKLLGIFQANPAKSTCPGFEARKSTTQCCDFGKGKLNL